MVQISVSSEDFSIRHSDQPSRSICNVQFEGFDVTVDVWNIYMVLKEQYPQDYYKVEVSIIREAREIVDMKAKFGPGKFPWVTIPAKESGIGEKRRNPDYTD